MSTVRSRVRQDRPFSAVDAALGILTVVGATAALVAAGALLAAVLLVLA